MQDRLSAVDRTGWAVESREEAIAGGLHLAAVEMGEVIPYRALVSLEHIPPALVAKLHGRSCGIDDVGEQHRREHAVANGHSPSSGEELLYFTEPLVRVLIEERMVIALELDHPRIRQVFGEPSSLTDVKKAIAGAMQEIG